MYMRLQSVVIYRITQDGLCCQEPMCFSWVLFFEILFFIFWFLIFLDLDHWFLVMPHKS